MRALARLFFAALLRVFFRRLQVAGRERLPERGPAVVVLNHPSALVDPALIMTLVKRPVSFLAKEPLFRMPVIGSLVRAFDAIPVYRKQDNADTAQNRLTFEKARAVLAGGGILALFPEGTSHDDPKLRPLKTGAARIALGAAAGGLPIQIVPAGLYFTDKGSFRSEALLSFGEPFPVVPAELGPDLEPPSQSVHALTDQIERGLATVTLQAEEQALLDLAARAERILSAGSGERADLARKFDLRKRLVEGQAILGTTMGPRLERLERRLGRFESALEQAGVSPQLVDPGQFRLATVLSVAARTLLFLLALLPLAIAGALIHWPIYQLVRALSRKMAADDRTMLATVKLLASLVFYPALWLALGVAAGVRLSWPAGLGAMALAIGGAAGALAFFERFDWAIGALRALGLFAFRRRAFLRLAQEREAIRDELLALGAELERQQQLAAPGA